MTPPTKKPVFLQRASYRQRRLRDGAKLVPFVGIVLWLIPVAWRNEGSGEPVGSSGVLYVFGVWVLLILLTVAISSRMRSDASLSDQDTSEE